MEDGSPATRSGRSAADRRFASASPSNRRKRSSAANSFRTSRSASCLPGSYQVDASFVQPDGVVIQQRKFGFEVKARGSVCNVSPENHLVDLMFANPDTLGLRPALRNRRRVPGIAREHHHPRTSRHQRIWRDLRRVRPACRPATRVRRASRVRRIHAGTHLPAVRLRLCALSGTTPPAVPWSTSTRRTTAISSPTNRPKSPALDSGAPSARVGAGRESRFR